MIVMEEIWKDIEGFEGYQVSNLGNVRSLDRVVVNSLGHNCHYKGRYMSKHKDNKGYLRASIGSKDNLKLRPIHRLVALAFIDNPDNKPEVNHIDEDKTNNNVNNLEWTTTKENNHWGTRTERARKSLINNDSSTKVIAINLSDLTTMYLPSMTEAFRLGLCSGPSIVNAIIKNYKSDRTANGYTYVKLEDFNTPDKRKRVLEYARKLYNSLYPKPVFLYNPDTGDKKIYESQHVASVETGITQGNLSYAIKAGTRAKGYYASYIKESLD